MSIHRILTGLFIVLCFKTASACSFITTFSTVVSPTCYGTCDGSVLMVVSGSTGPYIVTGPGGTLTTTGTININGLCAGFNTIMVSDAAGCTETYVITVTSPPELILNTTVTPGSGCTGSITASSSGGTGAVMYALNGGMPQASPVFSGLCPGSYTVCVIDANGCTDCETVTVTTSCTMVSTVFVTSPLACYGECDAEATLVSTGGMAPYSFNHPITGVLITYGTGGTVISGLCAGTYTLLITDGAGCTNVQVFTVIQPAEIEISPDIVNETGAGVCDGSISIDVTGGDPPYVFSVDGGMTYMPSADFSGLCSGTYNICVMDANGCVRCEVVTVGSDTPCSMVSTVFLSSPVSCYGSCDGAATLLTSGGTAPFIVTWTGSSTPLTYTGSVSIFDFCAGSYDFTVTDVMGCTNLVSLTFTEPPQIVFTTTETPSSSSCDGEISVDASGGTPGYAYSVDGGASYQVSSTFTGLCSGSYDVCVMDNAGCTVCSEEIVPADAGCTMVTTVFPTSPVSCNGSCDGEVTLLTSGGTAPFIVTWTGSSSPLTFMGSVSITGLCAGSYDFTVTDIMGCTNTVSLILTAPSPMISTIFPASMPTSGTACDGVINGAVTGGTAPYSYNWISCPAMSPVGNTSAPPAGGFCSGMYAFIVTDANGCSDTSFCITLSAPTGLQEIQNHEISLYPNPTTGEIVVEAPLGGLYTATLTDMTGRQVLQVVLNGKTRVDLTAMGAINGIYLISIQKENKTVYKQRLILAK